MYITFLLIVLNIISLGVIAMSDTSGILGRMGMDHHSVYNCIVYGLIIIFFIRIMNRGELKQTV